MLWLEASATAVAYASLGVGASRRGRRGLAVLAAVLVSHAVLAAIAWRLAGGPGDGPGLLIARALVGAEAVAGWGLAALLGRARVDRGVAASLAALAVIVLVSAPATGEPLARASAAPARVRSVAHAASPPFAASVALGLDVRHDPVLYGILPAAVMEMHMIPWIWTASAFFAAGTLFSFAALVRPSRRGALATVVVFALVVGGAGCKKKSEPAATKDPIVATGTGTAAAAIDAAAAPVAPPIDVAGVDAAIGKGVDFLASARGPGDLIGGHPGTTALAALAMVTSGMSKDDPRVAPSLAALAKLAKPDGAIFDKDYPVYVTAIATLAFQQAGAHPELVAKAQRWLADKQFGEKHEVDGKNPNYGGVGYGVDEKHPDADLSNLHFALDAIKDAPLTDRAEVLARAQKFLERCQNRTESNDQKWAANDGGFVYKPGASKAGATASSGSMTYAGIAGFLYTQADAKDPRVAAALDYIRANYSVDENPGMGLKGLYYHHHMMARALGLVGQRTLVDGDGQSHDWPVELVGKLVSMQKPDGSWANTDETFWENNPAIASSRAVLALGHARAAMK